MAKGRKSTEKKGKKAHRKTVNVSVSKFYKVTGDTVERLGKNCPKCGEGVKMGAHKSADGRIRYSCGKCGTTIWE
jgi:small subunit ribosomal protein S27Ae